MGTTTSKTAEMTKPLPAAAMMSQAAQTTAHQASTMAAEGAAKTKVAMEKGMQQVNKTAQDLFKAAEEAAEFGRGNVEAIARAAQTYAQGMQDLGRQTMAMMQGLTDHALASAKALTAVKSLKEAAEIQTSFGRAALERGMSDGAKLQEAALKVAEQAMAPISARMTLAVEKMGSMEKFARPLAA